MAGLKIKGDISEINDKQLEFIKSVLEKRGFKNSNVIIEPLGNAGDNYMASVKRIVVEDGNGKPLKMVVKCAPQNEMQRAFSNAGHAFRNEHIMYTKVLPKFTQLENSVGVPPQERFKYPVCYGSSDDAPNELIILEDLGESNFTTFSRLIPLNNDCIRSVIKNLAQYHSLGFALKYKEPQNFDEYKSELQDMLLGILNTKECTIMLNNMAINIASILTSDVHKKAVKESLNNRVFNYVNMCSNDANSKHAVIQHGDSWTSNFMFYIDGDRVESMLIDYQIAKASNPAVDLLFMLSICTEYGSRKRNFYEWIDFYHSELDKFISNFGLKSDFVYPKDQLDVDLKRYGKVICGQVIFMLVLMTMKNDQAEVMKEAIAEGGIEAMSKSADINSRDAESIERFKTKIEGLIDSFVEFGLL